ncbi:MAG: formate transporter FocA [Succinivibrio sp.]|jgi:formate transporter|nr:formate transporter FocA [Succinivibrio sp.]
MSDTSPLQALSAAAIAQAAEHHAYDKASKKFKRAFLLAILAGAAIALAFCFYTTAVAALGDGTGKIVGGLFFALGLFLVVLLGGELFTSSTLTLISRANGQITTFELLKNWATVYFGNLVGALIIVAIIFLGRTYMNFHTGWGLTILNTAAHKIHHIQPSDGEGLYAYCRGFIEAVCLGIVCNIMVCVAVWLSWGGKTVTDKLLVMLFPIGMFVASGFEHSIANMFMIPMGIVLENFSVPEFANAVDLSKYADLTVSNFILNNLIPVTIGNIIGGGMMIGLFNWYIWKKTV